MYILDPRSLGIGMLVLVVLLVCAKWLATGSLLERPKGSGVACLANVYNLVFLLVANPLAALLLAIGNAGLLLPPPSAGPTGWLPATVELGGLALYVSGAALMFWALVSLGRSYQLGGVAPRRTDSLIVSGPYRWVRHPLYTAALCLSLGLSGLLHSVVYLAAFAGYGVLLSLLIPREEAGLTWAYGAAYTAYRRHVKALVPFLL